MRRDVFICHSLEDQKIADAVCAALESANIDCWVAPRDLRSAHPVPGEITRAIRQSKIMVLILSGYSNKSGEVLRQVQLATDCNLPIVQFRIEEVFLADDLAYLLSAQRRMDAVELPLSTHVANLTNIIKEILGGPVEATPEDSSATNLPVANVSPDKLSAVGRIDSWYWKMVLSVIALVVAVFVVRECLNTCLDTPVSKLIPDGLTTALVLISLAIVAAPYLAGQNLGSLAIPTFAPGVARALMVGGPLLVIFVVVALFVPLKFVLRQDCDPIRPAGVGVDRALRDGTAEEARGAWKTAWWHDGGHFEIATDQAHSGSRSFKISATEPNHLRWVQPLRLEANTNYLLTAWIRTEDVARSGPNEAYDLGANLAIQFTTSPAQQPICSVPVFGTHDWQQISVAFSTQSLLDTEVQLQLGAYSSTTTGTVWFDDVELKRLP